MTETTIKEQFESRKSTLLIISGIGEIFAGIGLFVVQLEDFAEIYFPALEKNFRWFSLIALILLLFIEEYSKNRAINPRAAKVTIQKRSTKLISKLLDIIGIAFFLVFILCLIIVFAVLIFHWRPSIDFIRSIDQFPSIFFAALGFVVVLAFSHTAYKYDIPRFYIHALLLGSYGMLYSVLPKELALWAQALIALYLTLVGTLVLIRFIIKYPKPKEA